MIERHKEEDRSGEREGLRSGEETEVGIKREREGGGSEVPRVGERVEKEGCNP